MVSRAREQRLDDGETKILWDYELIDVPGKSLVGLELYYPPGGSTPSHRHGGLTAVTYILEGELLSGMSGDVARVYGPGDTFIEQPDCHHTVEDNNSKMEPIKAIVVIIVDTAVLKSEKGYAALIKLD
jgi:quercetin dioxygenase-like cupin family protein